MRKPAAYAAADCSRASSAAEAWAPSSASRFARSRRPSCWAWRWRCCTTCCARCACGGAKAAGLPTRSTASTASRLCSPARCSRCASETASSGFTRSPPPRPARRCFSARSRRCCVRSGISGRACCSSCCGCCACRCARCKIFKEIYIKPPKGSFFFAAAPL